VTVHAEERRIAAEQQAAFDVLGALDDPLAAVVRRSGLVDAYESRLPVVVHDSMEWLVFAITGQQISVLAAAAVFRRLRTALGGTVDPASVLAADPDVLRGAGLSFAKVRYIRALAERIDDGRLEVGRFATLSDELLEAELVAVPGIGPWTARMFLMRHLHRPDVFPAGDLGVIVGLTALDGLPRRITEKAAERRSEAWRPYRSYATRYLWDVFYAVNPPNPVLLAASMGEDTDLPPIT
jgi:DNA-3-methyladenine glycosylase II